jgi:hypothetical protein
LETQTLVTLHKAIQRAFHWYNDHLYSFFLSDKERDEDSEYTKPLAKREEDLFFKGPRSANISLRRLHLRKGQRLAYVYDFGDNIRIELHVRGMTPAKRIKYPRTVTLRGFSPEQYNYAEGRYSPKISATVASKTLPMVRVSGTRKCEGSLLLEWSDTSHIDSGQAA